MDAGRVSRVIFVFSNSSLLCVFLTYTSLSGTVTWPPSFFRPIHTCRHDGIITTTSTTSKKQGESVWASPHLNADPSPLYSAEYPIRFSTFPTNTATSKTACPYGMVFESLETMFVKSDE